MSTPTGIIVRALVGAVLAILGALGVLSPDDASNEELVDTLAAAVGAVILLFTPRIDRRETRP